MQDTCPVRGAILDTTGMYRYSLWREWNTTSPRVLFVMLNPSTADAIKDDPTIRRCMAFARSWGYGSLEVVNLFAYRTSHPAALRAAPDPVGPDNDRHLLAATQRADLIVAAWGHAGGLLNRNREVMRQLRGPIHCLGTTQRGHPRHPLYLKRETYPLIWQISPRRIVST